MRTIRLPIKGAEITVTNHRIFSNIKLLLVEVMCTTVIFLLSLLHDIDLDAYLIIDRNYEFLFLYSEDHNFLDRTFSSETFVLCCNPVITNSY